MQVETWAALLTQVLGRPIRYVPASLGGYAWHLLMRRGAGLMQSAIWTVLHEGLRHGDAAVIDPLLPALLGQPARDLEAFISDHAAVWRRP